MRSSSSNRKVEHVFGILENPLLSQTTSKLQQRPVQDWQTQLQARNPNEQLRHQLDSSGACPVAVFVVATTFVTRVTPGSFWRCSKRSTSASGAVCPV